MKRFWITSIALIVMGLFCTATLLAADPAAGVVDGKRPSGDRPEPPSELVSLELWIVTLGDVDVDDDTNDGQIDHLLARVGNLPTVVGRRDDARALIGRLKERNAIRKIQEFRLSTLNGHEASIIAGERQPRITGITISQFGKTNNLQYHQLGTAVHLTPQADGDGSIRVRVKFETSDVEDSRDVALAVPAKGESTYASIIVSATVDTVVSLNSGEAVLVARTLDGAKHATRLVILSAAVVEPKSAAVD